MTLQELTFNHGGKQFTREIEDFLGFAKLADLLPNTAYRVIGAYIKTGGRYGDEANLVLENAILSLPKHKVQIVKEFIISKEIIEKINAGELFVTSYDYVDKDNVDRQSCHFWSIEQIGDEKDLVIGKLETVSNPKKADDATELPF